MFSIRSWRQRLKERDEKRENTLGRLLHTCIFLPFVIFIAKLLTEYYEWGLLSLGLAIPVIILLGYKTEDAIFRILGKYSFKTVKASYSYLISLTVVLGFMYFVLGMYQ